MSIETSREPEAFTAFEHSGWQDNSAGYEAHWSRLVSQSIEPCLDAAGVRAGQRVLDVCCGPGTLTGEMLARGARPLGVDFSRQALALARDKHPEAQFQEADAQALPFDDDSFDAAVCGFGLMHVADPRAVLAETRRVLRPGSRLAVSVWQAPDASNGFGVLFGALKTHGNLEVDLPHGPDFFQFGDPERMVAALQGVGLHDAQAYRVEQVWDWQDPLGIVRAVLEGAVRARALLNAQNDAARQAIDAAVTEGMDRWRDAAGRYRIPMPAILGSGVK
jgi:SAM-dependent methyltransferase